MPRLGNRNKRFAQTVEKFSRVGTFVSIDFRLVRQPIRWLWLLALGGLLYPASLTTYLDAPASIVATSLLFVRITSHLFRQNTRDRALTHLGRSVIIAYAVFDTLCYFLRRTDTTVENADPFNLVAAMLLYAAGIYGIGILFLGYSSTRRR